jgi:hypothetical protein
MRYTNCRFFAERTSARKGADFSGGVVIVETKPSADHINGECVKALGTPRGGTRLVPSATWVSKVYLTKKCVEVTEVEARALAPEMFRALESFDRSSEFRAMYEVALREARDRGKYTLQSAE